MARDNRTHIHLNDQEEQRIQEAADQLGMQPPQLIRTGALRYADKVNTDG